MGETWQFSANKEDAQAGYKLLEPGEYKFSIIEKEDKTTAEKGYPMVLLKLQAVEGPSEGGMLHNVVQIPQGEKGHGFMLHFLHAVGLPYDGDVEFDTDDFIGREFSADVTVEEYTAKDGSTKTRNNIKRVLVIEEELTEKAADPEPEPEEKPKPIAKKAAPAPIVRAVAKSNGNKKEDAKKQLVGAGKRRF